MDFDTGGRAIVLEMPFFPSAASDSGRTKLLEDTNNDGRPDRASPVPRGSAIPMRLANWKEERDRTQDPQGHRFGARFRVCMSRWMSGAIASLSARGGGLPWWD